MSVLSNSLHLIARGTVLSCSCPIKVIAAKSVCPLLTNLLYIWSLGNGKKVSFWHANCNELGTLKDEFPEIFQWCKYQSGTASKFWNGRTNTWHVPLKANHPHQIRLQADDLAASLMAHIPQLEISDRVQGQGYSTKNHYRSLWKDEPDCPISDSIFKLNHLPLKIQFLSWLASLNKLHTLSTLKLKGIIQDTTCIFCCNQEENLDHLLLNCPYTCFWKALNTLTPNLYLGHFSSTADLFGAFVGQNNLDINTKTLICCAFWGIWRNRNDRLYGDCALVDTAVLA